jgi:predicted metal-dependent peptidase
MKPATIMTRARTRLLLDAPWFGSLAMRLRFESKPEVQTMATDGTTLFYAPEFVATLPDAELCGIIAHEVMHCALLHPFRRGSRDLKLWNQATDYVINSELTAAGFRLPADVLIDPKYNGLSAETTYAQLYQKQTEQTTPPQPDPQAPPLSTGTVEDAPQAPQGQPDPTQAGDTATPPQAMAEDDWKIAAEQANAVSKAAGNLPGGASRAAKLARESRHDWRADLSEFLEHTQPSDYSWSAPNRRHIADGLYLPGIVKENAGVFVWCSDTSGSISSRLLDIAWAEFVALVREMRPERVIYYGCDTDVELIGDWTPDDIPDTPPAHHGGGGTRFSPLFDAVAALDDPPACLLYFTDLECYDRPTEPDYPVLWVTGQHVTRSEPFGRRVRIDLNA